MPTDELVVSRLMLVSGSVRLIFAFGMTALEASLTVPLTVPAPTWPQAADIVQSKQMNLSTTPPILIAGTLHCGAGEVKCAGPRYNGVACVVFCFSALDSILPRQRNCACVPSIYAPDPMPP